MGTNTLLTLFLHLSLKKRIILSTYAPYSIRPQYVSINLYINLNVIRHKYFKLRVYMEIKKILNAGRDNGS